MALRMSFTEFLSLIHPPFDPVLRVLPYVDFMGGEGDIRLTAH